MAAKTIKILDPRGRVMATGSATAEGGLWGGKLDLHSMPKELCDLFAEFEEVVSGQMFSFVDDIQDRIAALALRVAADDGPDAPIADLQFFPSSGDFSFRSVEVLANGQALTD